jgi:hypothetical protein
MSGVNWNALQPVDVVGAVNRGMMQGAEMRSRHEQRNALLQYQNDPVGGVNAMLSINPDLAMRLSDDHRQNQKAQQEVSFRKAASGYIGAQGQDADAEFMRLIEIDPMAAMKVKSARRDEILEHLKGVDEAYSIAIQHLGSVADDDSYQRVLETVASRVQPLGIDLRGMVPAKYPGPEGVRQLLQSAMEAKDQIAALQRGDRLEADVADDEADNSRADRVAGNLIETRNRNAATSERRAAVSERNASARRAGPKGKSRPGAKRPTATGPNGAKVEWDGKDWVPVQ